MSSAAFDSYRARFRKVLEYIDAHLDEELGVERLSGVAAFSKHHFHRQFAGLFGMGVFKYVQLNRMKRALYRLAFRRDESIIDVALASGYEGPEAFARAFKKSVGQSPSEFRKQPEWNPWFAIYQPISELRANYMATAIRADRITIVSFKETKIAAFEHRGDPRRLGSSIRKFIEWRKESNLAPKSSAIFNIVYDNPTEVALDDYRFDICAATTRDVASNAFGVVGKVIPAGRCAVLRHIGSDDNLSEAVRYLYSEWFPQSGEELRDFPLYWQRVSFFPDVPEREAVTDVFLPLR